MRLNCRVGGYLGSMCGKDSEGLSTYLSIYLFLNVSPLSLDVSFVAEAEGAPAGHLGCQALPGAVFLSWPAQQEMWVPPSLRWVVF